jgi:hypothetical protein
MFHWVRECSVDCDLRLKEVRMLESTVNLMDGLFFIAVILLTAFCIFGSIVAALHAISRGAATSESSQGKFVDDMQPVERPLADQVLSVDDVLNPVGPKKAQSGPGMPRHIYRANEKKAVRG